MKKDIEWLKNEIEIMGSETSENYPHEQMVDRELVIKLVEGLDEPEKVVIPKFVADAFEKAKGDNWFASPLVTAMYKSSDEVGYWLEVPSNEKLLLRAWLDDSYEIEKEKEKLYYIELIKGKRCMAQVADGTCWFPYGRKDVLSGVDKIKFTEQEIKAIDERFWPFAVEVSP